MNGNEKLPTGWVRVKSKSRPDKEYFYNQKLKMSLWKLEDLKTFSENQGDNGIEPAMPSPTKRVSPRKTSWSSGLSDQSKVIGRKNVARDRMTKLQKVLEIEVKRGVTKTDLQQMKRKTPKSPAKGSGSVDKKNIASQRLKQLNSSLIEEVKRASSGEDNMNHQNQRRNEIASSRQPKIPLKFTAEAELEREVVDVDMQDLSHQEQPLSQPEPYPEAMDWEDVPEQEVISGVQMIRTLEGRTSSLIDTVKKERRLNKTTFYVIVDTNVLLSNIDFVKDIKGKRFKDIGKATIYLPYIVLCELDKIKSYDDKLAKLARRAILFIDDCFAAKDPFVIGQSGVESFRKQIIAIESGDDEILNCCLNIQETTVKMILLTNDRNLRNKAFVNKIEAFSRDTLNFADFNIRNDIRFEGNC